MSREMTVKPIEIPKNCWLDDEPDICPSPCVFDDPEEFIGNCCLAVKLHAGGLKKTDCQHYKVPPKADVEHQAIDSLPTDEELDELWDEEGAYYALYEEARQFARAVLQKWGSSD